MEHDKTVFRATTALLCTLASTDDGTAPEGILYAAMMPHGVDHETYQRIARGLVAGGFVRRFGTHVMAITDKGRALAKEVEDAVKRLKAIKEAQAN